MNAQPPWSDWQWHAEHQRYFRSRLNNSNQWEFDWAQDNQYSSSTPRDASALTSQAPTRSSHAYTDSYGSNYTANTSRSSPEQQNTAGYSQYSQHHSYDQQSGSSSYGHQQPGSNVYGASPSSNLTTQLQDYGASPGPSNQAATTEEAAIPPQRRIKAQDATKEAEALSPKFRKLKDKDQIRRFFRPGRVFSLLWTEPSSANLQDTEMNDAFTEVRFGQTVYTEIRRFIVIRAFTHHSLCAPIATYKRYATTRRPDAAHHSIAYSVGHSPQLLEGETLSRDAIPIITAEDETLELQSRINFSKIYTIEHNVKVNAVGKVHPDYLELVRQYCKESTNIY